MPPKCRRAVTHVQVILAGVIQDLPKEPERQLNNTKKPCKLSMVIYLFSSHLSSAPSAPLVWPANL